MGHAQKGPPLQRGVSVVVRNGRPESCQFPFFWGALVCQVDLPILMFDEENEKELCFAGDPRRYAGSHRVCRWPLGGKSA